MNILIIGQCTLHWGRMEFGNIGNYYIMEPLIRELHRVFPDAKIRTTFQMSTRFCEQENLEVVSMDYYYGWKDNDLEKALQELSSASLYAQTGYLPLRTPYIKEVLAADLVIDFSGDIWGDNADFLGADRFLVGLCKDRVAQLLGKPTVMIAGSPGPFNNQKTKEFAKEVYKNFNLVTNREPVSVSLLQEDGFDVSKTKSLACPAFLFEPLKNLDMKAVLSAENIPIDDDLLVGFVLCGWNFTEGPFDKEQRNDTEYSQFVNAVRHLTEQLGAKVLLMSHANGFDIPPKEFKMKHGRDYPIIKQLQRITQESGIKNVYALDGIYDTWTTKAIISNFDMLVSGRVHAAVAGLSQNIPTVLIDYGHEPRAHKIQGFAKVAGAENYIADPSIERELIDKINLCWKNRTQYTEQLDKQNLKVKQLVHENFDLMAKML